MLACFGIFALGRHHPVVRSAVQHSGRVGGVGSGFAQALRDADVDVPARVLGLPQEFLVHASRGEIL
ncbi:hypothetical protein VM98_38035, partial [Streptomyces rubellomurinus subsp. indigoferus]